MKTEDFYVDVAGLADRLGLTMREARRLVRDREIPSIVVGAWRRVQIPVAAIDVYVLRQAGQTGPTTIVRDG